MRQSDDISQRRSLVAGEIRPIAGAQATSVAQRCADKRPALALLITAALSSAAIAAPSFEVTIFDLPNLNNNSGTGDRLRIDMSGNVAPVTLPSIAGFYTADRNASGLLAGTCNTSGTGAGNAACLYDTAASALSTFGGGTSGAYNVNEAGDVLWGPRTHGPGIRPPSCTSGLPAALICRSGSPATGGPASTTSTMSWAPVRRRRLLRLRRCEVGP